jgi:hypothetical protein
MIRNCATLRPVCRSPVLRDDRIRDRCGGYFESGHGRSGDGLEWWHDGTLHVGRCAAVVTIREVPIQDPVTVGIVIDGASPYDIREGDVITVHSAEP